MSNRSTPLPQSCKLPSLPSLFYRVPDPPARVGVGLQPAREREVVAEDDLSLVADLHTKVEGVSGPPTSPGSSRARSAPHPRIERRREHPINGIRKTFDAKPKMESGELTVTTMA